VRHWLRRALIDQPVSSRDARVREVVDHLRTRVPLTTMPAFAGDSLVSWHNPEFLDDPDFIRAYDIGRQRRSWDLTIDIRWRFHVFLWAARRAATLPGDFVECGVNRGGFSRAIVDYIDFRNLDKTFYLMDTFSGHVDEYFTPEERAMGLGRDTYAFEESYEDVRAAFADVPNVRLVRGPIPDTLDQVTPDRVSYLMIDMNAVVPEMAAAAHFWPRLVPGAAVVLDDYGHGRHVHQKHAFDAFARERGVEVLMLPTGQGLLFKP
jgi:O-methyltransferase